MESKEESSLANGDINWSTSWHCIGSRRGASSNDDRNTNLCRWSGKFICGAFRPVNLRLTVEFERLGSDGRISQK